MLHVWVGQYQLAPGLVITIRADGEKLYGQLTGQPEFALHPESLEKWRLRVVDAQLTFELPDEGSATAVTLHQNGRDMRSPRKE